MGAPEELAQAAHRRASQARLFAAAVILLALGSCWVVYRLLAQPPELLEPYRLRNLLNAAKLYRIDVGRFPSTTEGLEKLAPKYVAHVGDDGWGRPYHYESDGGSARIWTLGRDGTEGGVGPDADLSVRFPPEPNARTTGAVAK